MDWDYQTLKVLLTSLDQIYKIHIRPHFDYCDMIYNRPIINNDFSSSLSLNHLMKTLEKTQYEVALAITGTWKGTNTDKLYEELGWESLHQRRVFRRLTMFYKIYNNLTPTYLKTPLVESNCTYSLRSTRTLTPIPCKTNKYKNSFYPDVVDLWNKLDRSVSNSPTLSMFK